MQLKTEAVPIYRNLFGGLFAPIMDASDDNSLRNYAFTTDSTGNNWSEVDKVDADHNFDIAYTERFHTISECTPQYGCTIMGVAGDIWIVGARLNSAVVRVSVDGGRTFSQSLAVTPEPNPYGLTHSRFYFAGVIQNKLYVQPYDFSAGNNPNQGLRRYSYVLDGANGTSWQQGPDLFPSRGDQYDSGYAPQVFNNYMVYLTHFPTEGATRRLRAFSPTTGTITNIDFLINGTNTNVTNFTIYGQYFYVLLGNGSVGRTTDITLPWSQWETYPPLHANGYCATATKRGSQYRRTRRGVVHRHHTSATVQAFTAVVRAARRSDSVSYK